MYFSFSEAASLDNWITGHYGEDQSFIEEDEPELEDEDV